jgi:NADH:ubiquinone oxidoreductase subunit 2 (subunit N)
VANEGFLWLAGLAIFSSLISLYYYLQVIRQMYIQPALAAAEATAVHESAEALPSERATLPASPSALLLTVMALGLLAVLWLGVYPAPLLEVVEAASRAILPGG